MFLALRELRYARGRFGLMGVVVALIAFLIVMLSGLSSGLVNDGVSGLKRLPADVIVFDQGTKTDNAFSRSLVEPEQIAVWQQADGVKRAEPVGAGMVNAVTDAGVQITLSLFALESDSFLAPALSEGHAANGLGEVVLSDTAKEQGLELGDVIVLDQSELELTVVGFTEGQSTFGHVDMAYLPLDTWRLIAAGQAGPGAPTQEQVDALSFEYASVVAVELADPDLDLAAIDARAETMAVTLREAFNSSPGYEAETLTLEMIQYFRYVIATAITITIVLGLAGAMVAVLRILRINPINALGGQRQ